MPRVSVVLPVRDGARYLREAVESVLGQSLADLELIVVDDGSTDETPSLLAGFDDRRLRVLRQDRLGLVPALNRGLEAAKAPYVARMDADDVSLPERLERQVAFLDAHPRAVLVVPGVELMDEEGHGVGTLVLPPADADLRRRLLLRNPITHGSVVARRSALEAVGGYRAAHGANEDYDLWRRLARDWELAALPDLLYRYRVHPGAVTKTDPERVARREALRDELWREPSLLRAAAGERDPVEARALAREALRRGRFALALRLVRPGLSARRRSPREP
jgi:glycosyltransferase involved in cell wall biosynthesis